MALFQGGSLCMRGGGAKTWAMLFGCRSATTGTNRATPGVASIHIILGEKKKKKGVHSGPWDCLLPCGGQLQRSQATSFNLGISTAGTVRTWKRSIDPVPRIMSNQMKPSALSLKISAGRLIFMRCPIAEISAPDDSFWHSLEDCHLSLTACKCVCVCSRVLYGCLKTCSLL